MDVQITKKNGESFILSDYGVLVKDFIVSSIPIESEKSDIEGRPGTVDRGARYGARTITVPFRLITSSLLDYPLARDAFYGTVLDLEPYYVREMRRLKKMNYEFVDPGEPARMNPDSENRFINGKRYLVRLQNTIDPEQIETDGEGELVFETTNLPFAESIGTTQDIQKNGIDADSGLWGFGMGLIVDEEALKYTHKAEVGKPFRVYNAGNVTVHPFYCDLKMTIRNVQGSTDMFQIINLTNGSRVRINVPVKPTDTIVYDGPNVTRNGLAFLRDTQKNFIELSPGWNTFRIYYCESATIEFDFRFYYL